MWKGKIVLQQPPNYITTVHLQNLCHILAYLPQHDVFHVHDIWFVIVVQIKEIFIYLQYMCMSRFEKFFSKIDGKQPGQFCYMVRYQYQGQQMCRYTHAGDFASVVWWQFMITDDGFMYIYIYIIIIMYVLEWRKVYVLTRRLLWCLFPELRNN